MKLLSILILLSLIQIKPNCQNGATLSLGKYSNKVCNPLMRMIHESFYPNDNFILKDNQMYEYFGCNSVQNGNWIIKHDTLILHCISHSYTIDSLNRLGFNGRFAECPKPLKFIIRTNCVEALFEKRCYFLVK